MESNFTFNASSECLRSADNAFGPAVVNCRSSFDFTLLFEQTILSIIPSAIFLLLVPFRLFQLYKSSTKTIRNALLHTKTFVALSLAALELTLLILWAINSTYDVRTKASVPSAVFSFLAALAILFLSSFEHSKSVKPSTLLTTYLLFSLVLDLAQSRTLYLRHDETTIAAVFSATMGLKLMLLLMESRGKRSYLKSPFNTLPPESTSGIINKSFFWWLNSIFIAGYKEFLTIGSLHFIPPELASEPLHKSMQLAWDMRSKPEGKYTLPMTFARSLKWPLLSAFPPRLCMIGFNYAQPFLISRAIDFMFQSHDARSNNEGYGLIAAAGLIYLGIAVSKAHYNHRIYRVMTMFRGAMVAMIFNHTVSLQDGVHDGSAALTLMSTDIDRITTSMRRVNEVWANFFEVAIGVGLLAREIGWISILPVVLLVMCSQGSSQVAKQIGGRQRIWVTAVQQRVGATASMLGSMKAVKMMGLTTVMTQLIQGERIRELNLQKRFRWLTFWINVIGDIPQSFSPVLAFVAFAIQAKVNGSASLTTTQALTSLALISLVSGPAAQLLVSVPSVTAALGCFQRIQAFLLSPLRMDMRTNPEGTVHRNEPKEKQNLSTNLLAKSQIELLSMRQTLKGSLGSSAIIIEKLTASPSVDSDFVLCDISMRVEFGSLNMILGPVGAGKSILLKAILGEIPLISGSISVAASRIAYCAQSPWLVNATIQENITCSDVGTAIDENWYRTVVHACALDQDLQQLPDSDRTIIGSRGVTLSGGQKQRVALARAIYARFDIVLLDDILSALDRKTEDLVVERLLGPSGLFKKLGTTTVLVTHSTRHLNISNQIVVLNSSGQVERQGIYDELQTQQDFLSAVLPQLTLRIQEHRPEKPIPPGIKKLVNPPSEEQTHDLTRRTGDIAIYSYYLKYVGWQDAALLLSILVTCVFALKFPQIILEWWTKDNGKHTVQWIVIYTMLAVVSLAGNVGAIWAMMIRIAPKTAFKLHDTLLQKAMSAPQAFFSKTDTGFTLNRFSQDMTLVEGSLPQAVLLTIRTVLESLATAALISTGSSYMAITIPFLIIAIYSLQNVYLKTSRQLRFLDLEAKSPLYSHFLATIEGTITIRAFDWVQRVKSTNFKLLDNSQKPCYMLFCIQRWLELVLDLIVGALAVIVVALAVTLRNSSNAALLGIALNNVLSFTSVLSILVTFWTELETSLGAIARLRNFEIETVSEHRGEECVIPPASWPSQGGVEIRGVGVSYHPSISALQNVNITIAPGEKVGICGRTGSGKSTLIATLLRLLDLDCGQILIDGIDISTLPKNLLRERLTAVPQDPFILNGSVRLNADPTGTIPDDLIIAALQKVQLWSILEARGGLDTSINAQPLSKGQQQVFCLGRALLKKSKILILDEATSNVDSETDRLMQEIIKTEFKECTVIMVAHRLETIGDADKIAVMERGRVVEFDRPEVLMERESVFRELNDST